MRKIFRLIYLLTMAALVLSMSGCGGSSTSSVSSVYGNSGRLMVIASPVLEKGESYNFYRGDKVSVRASAAASYDFSYYVAPLSGGENIAVNLEFSDYIIDDDQPFMITKADDDSKVVFFYNPKGNGKVDTVTEYGGITRWGGDTQKLSYNGLTLSGSSVSAAALRAAALGNTLSADEVLITLNADTGTATMNGTDIPSYDYVWHADPDHRDEYYTLGSSTAELTEDYVENAITENIYVARDIRYMPDTLNFTGTAKNDEETEYAAYYSDSVAAEVAAELGSGFDYELSGSENIFLNGAIMGYSEEFLKSRYDEIVEFAEIGEFIYQPLKTYSSGMMMRLAFSIATLVEPEILIVDEILAVGDERFQKKSHDRMISLMDGGTTVLMVSHNLEQIREMCSRVIWLCHGQVRMNGDTNEVCDAYHRFQIE